MRGPLRKQMSIADWPGEVQAQGESPGAALHPNQKWRVGAAGNTRLLRGGDPGSARQTDGQYAPRARAIRGHQFRVASSRKDGE